MSLLTGITIERPPILPPVLPPVLQFGAGLVNQVGTFARARGYRRVLVVSDAFNAGRVGLLDLPGEPAVFGEVRPEPAWCRDQGYGRTDPNPAWGHATQT